MRTYFKINAGSCRGIGDGETDGDNPIKQILQANATFVMKYRCPPSVLMMNPADVETMRNNQAVIDIGGGRLVGEHGRMCALPFLRLCEVPDVETGSAALEAEPLA